MHSKHATVKIGSSKCRHKWYKTDPNISNKCNAMHKNKNKNETEVTTAMNAISGKVK